MERTTSRQVAGIAELGDEVLALRAEVRRLGARVDRLEAARAPAPAMPPAVAPAAAGGAARPAATTTAVLASALPAELTHVGRLLLVLAGGFLLRAATEAGQLARPLGVALGLAYAFSWLFAALRAEHRSDGVGAAFHAGATLAIAYPLLWEATTRFAVLSPGAGALALAAATGLLLAAAWRQRSAAIAWLATGATAATALLLTAATRQPAPYAAVLVALAAAGLALAERRGWRALSWATAALANLAVALVILGATLPREPLPALAALSVALALLLVHLVGAAMRVRGRSRLPGSLLAQLAASVAVGGGGALLVASRTGGAIAVGVGVVALALGAATQAFALARVSAGDRATRSTFLAAATALLLGGTALLVPEPSLVWSALALAAALGAARAGEPSVGLQAALTAGAGLLAAGTLARAGAALLLPDAPPAPWSAAAALAPLLAAACLGVLSRAATGHPLWRTATALLAALLAWTASGALAALAAAAVPNLAADAGLRSAAATWMLAAAGALLARLGRSEPIAAVSWLVYPWLVAMALQVLLVVLPHGRPLSIFLALAALGAALLGAARSARRSPAPA